MSNLVIALPPCPEPFDPALLPLTGWWRTNYVGAMLGAPVYNGWPGSISAGPSGASDRVMVGDQTPPQTPPAVGTKNDGLSLNGLTTAVYDGLTNATKIQYLNALSYVKAYEWYIGCLFRPLALAAGAPSPYDDPAIVDLHSIVSLAVSDAGFRLAAIDDQGQHASPADALPIVADDWHFAEAWMKRNDDPGGVAEIRYALDGVEGPKLDVRQLVQLEFAGVTLGVNWNDTRFFNGVLADTMIAMQPLPSSTRAAIRQGYISDRYALILGT